MALDLVKSVTPAKAAALIWAQNLLSALALSQTLALMITVSTCYDRCPSLASDLAVPACYRHILFKLISILLLVMVLVTRKAVNEK